MIHTFFSTHLLEFIQLDVWLWYFNLLVALQKGIDENWEAALEHNPEAFARVVCFTLVFSCFTFYALWYLLTN